MSRRELEDAARLVTRGAFDAAQRLDAVLRFNSRIGKMAYAVRIRQKRHDSIVEKVERKRKGDLDKGIEPRPHYDACDVRDIIGLRIITIYRNDTFDIVRHLAEFLAQESTPARSRDALFTKATVDEITIYSTNPTNDPQKFPQRIKEVLDSFNLGVKAEIDPKGSSYSSIHILTTCNGQDGENVYRVPLEIQIRTALEDIWGEIDHKIRYKEDHQSLSIREQAMLKSCKDHLQSLKTIIDGASQYADQIQLQAAQLEDGALFWRNVRMIVDTLDSLKRVVGLSDELKQRIARALENQAEAMRPDRRDKRFARSRVAMLREAADVLPLCISAAEEELRTGNGAKGDDHFHLRELIEYLLPMEVALCNYQIGVELGPAGDEFASKALGAYLKLRNTFPTKAGVLYRIGRTYVKLRDHLAAAGAYRKANEMLIADIDNSIPTKHWLRSSVPRNLGVSLWTLAEARKKDIVPRSEAGLETAASMEARREVESLLLEAYDVTFRAYKGDFEGDEFADEFEKATKHRGRLANNLIYYASDYIQLFGETPALAQKGYSAGKFNEFMELLERHRDVIDSPRTLHTLARHYQQKNLPESSKPIAKKLRKILEDQGVAPDVATADEKDMLDLIDDILGQDGRDATNDGDDDENVPKN